MDWGVVEVLRWASLGADRVDLGTAASLATPGSPLLAMYSAIISQIGEHLQAIFALGGFSFGIWRWWRYREKVLFQRLDEYLAREERRLQHARHALFETVLRPNVGRMVEPPRLARSSLLSALREWGLVSNFRFVGTDAAADQQLTTAAVHLQEQSVIREKQHLLLNQSIAAAQLLRGALAGASASHLTNPIERRAAARTAIDHFDDALRLPGNTHDLDAMELKLYQLISIQEYDAATALIEEMDGIIQTLPPSRERTLRLVRALKSEVFIERALGRNGNVNTLCSTALDQLTAYSPLVGNDLLDQAELFELQACARQVLNFANAARDSRNRAIQSYNDLINSLTRGSRFGRSWFRLRRFLGVEALNDVLYWAAEAGKRRIGRR